MVIEDDKFYQFGDDDMVVCCGECLKKDLKATAEHRLVGDERVFIHMVQPHTHTPVQCDNCLKQSPDYEDL
jgi:hypothetical protein